jgi:hypothetical protein
MTPPIASTTMQPPVNSSAQNSFAWLLGGP